VPAPLLLVLPLALLAAGPAAPAPAPDPAAATFAEAAAALRRDRGDPRGLAAIGRLHAVEPALVDQAALAQAYRAAAEDPKAHPEVAALARWRLAEVEEVRGNLHRAAAERARLGLVRGWWIAGPFDNEGRRGLAATYPPEAGIDLAARFPGKAREVGWRPLPPEAEARGVAQLGAVIRPQREVTVYALSVLDSPREQRVRLWTGASGALRAWVNGVEVLEDRAYHPARLDQAVVEVTLRRGPNRLLVKVCQDQGDMALAVRLTDLAGKGLALPAEALPPLPPAGTGAPPRPGKVETAVQVLARRAAAAKGEAEGRARMELAMALLEKQPEDVSEHAPAREAHRAADLLPRSAAAQLLAARLEDQDQGRRLDRLQAALRAEPANREARAEMAAHEARHERPQEAVRILESLVHDAPGWVGARVALAQARGRRGWRPRRSSPSWTSPRPTPRAPWPPRPGPGPPAASTAGSWRPRSCAGCWRCASTTWRPAGSWRSSRWSGATWKRRWRSWRRRRSSPPPTCGCGCAGPTCSPRTATRTPPSRSTRPPSASRPTSPTPGSGGGAPGSARGAAGRRSRTCRRPST
jgi:hypothetical protein